ncbi:hypothetical protein MHF_1461 [Mycoplasma haemofelis Ohio2]|uniref:Uncharacterized protein n=1 Tax=Mycoplasma haemofelis (strain Ohio2) TaxID=859194 RepID=F6FGY6_MYCHI|nr:hypothetical protein MHF_1461 [Mycoplasma haemofelis Ohio2]
MNTVESKAMLASVPAAGAVGTGAYFGLIRPSNSQETVKSKLEKAIKGKPRRLLAPTSHDIWEKYKALYKKESDDSKKISGVDENALLSWCESTLKKPYSEQEKEIYDQAFKWCVVNTNTLKQELESEKNLSFITFGDGDGSKWQKAWTKYNADKQGLEITDTSLSSSAISSADAGGPKLKDWCKAKLDKHMYEDLGEDKTIEKVTKYCVASRGE